MWATFISSFQHGPERMSEALRRSLSADTLDPILLDPHLDALDRRLAIILKIIRECIEKAQNFSDVIINDLF